MVERQGLPAKELQIARQLGLFRPALTSEFAAKRLPDNVLFRLMNVLVWARLYYGDWSVLRSLALARRWQGIAPASILGASGNRVGWDGPRVEVQPPEVEEVRVAEALTVSVPARHRLDPLVLAFIESAAAFVALSTTAFRMPSRCFLTIRAARTIGSSLLREAGAAQDSHAFLAQTTLT